MTDIELLALCVAALLVLLVCSVWLVWYISNRDDNWDARRDKLYLQWMHKHNQLAGVAAKLETEIKTLAWRIDRIASPTESNSKSNENGKTIKIADEWDFGNDAPKNLNEESGE